jgi:dsDNA-binding SOS-regulon protein
MAKAVASASGTPQAQPNEGNVYCADRREHGMAVIVKYVVVSNGKEDMIFTTKKEAEAHDKMLDIAERLSAFLQAAELNMAEDTLDALTVFIAQHREHIGTILKGGRLKTPDASAQQAAFPQDKEEKSSPSEHKSSKASQSAPTTKPKAAA